MPEAVYRFLLPTYAAVILVAVLGNRARLYRRLGRDPVLIRPVRSPDTPHGYLELALSLGSLGLAGDVLLNALWPQMVKERLAVPFLRETEAWGWAGFALINLGLLLSGAAVVEMADSWRMGIDREGPGPLVITGLFRWIRHPIYTGVLLATLGLAFLTADVLSIAIAAAAWAGIPVQARLEEEFLLSRHPGEYAAYRVRTGRFWPKLSHLERAR